MKNNTKKIGVIGMWHLGSIYAASLASLGFQVRAFDYEKKTIENLKKNIPPLFEPNLVETITKYKENLSFTSDEKEFFHELDYIFITFDLPVDDYDRVDLSLIERVIKSLKKYADPKSVLVVSSQVPVGTCRRIIQKSGKQLLIYFPENLRLGTAFDCFLNADRIVIGSDSSALLDTFETDFSGLKTTVIKMGLESAEMVKHALNSYLAMCISFSSEISDICERVAADMNDVVRALKSDKRVSPKAPLNPGFGFAGGTLGRDIQSLTQISKKNDYKPYLIPSIYKVNRNRIPELIQKIKRVSPHLKGKHIGILGLTYKPGTNTLRRSLSLELIHHLHREGVLIKAYDPVIKEQLPGMKYVTVSESYSDFFADNEMVILMTEWPEFKEIDFEKMAPLMKKQVVIDTKNFYNKDSLMKLNYIYKGIGLP